MFMPGLCWLAVLLPAGGKQQQFAWDGGRVIAINKELLDEGYTAAGETQPQQQQQQQPQWFQS
jgi:hypothetical protein